MTEIQRDVGLVRAFWHDDNFPYFLITWAPFDRDHGSGDGTAFTNAIWIFMSRLDSLSTQITQLTHESFHAWNPRRMGREPTGEEARIGWFHEGFTTYYADMIAYRAGLLPLDAVVRRANRDLSNFAGSRDAYTRGEVIALWLDGLIRDYSQGKRSLDTLMRDMVRNSKEPLTLERILSTANRYLPPSDQATLRELATGMGAPPATISAGALAPCVHVTLDSAYAFDAGFDVAASIRAHRVTDVRPGSAAYTAGLRDGQPLLGWSIYNGQAERQATFTIQADSARRRISYYPRGAGGLVPQLHIAADYAPRAGACGLAADAKSAQP
jgi:predicted metalloprotease with PDZ domain